MEQCPKQHKRPLSLQAALSVVIADLTENPVAVTAEGEIFEHSDCSSASVSSSEEDDDDDETETRGYEEKTETGGNRIKRPNTNQDAKLLAQPQQANPFAPIAADGSLLLVAPSVPLPHLSGEVSSAALRVPNPLLLQVLPPRLCASAVSIFAHKGERIFRLVVLGEGLNNNGGDDDNDCGRNDSRDTDTSFVPDDDYTSESRRAPPPSVTPRGSAVVLRHMYQVGQHYNLFPMLYCSCSAFKYLCLAPNSAPATMSLVADEEGSNNKDATSADRPNPLRDIFGGSLQSSNNTSNSLYCKHLAAVAMALSNSLKDEIHGEDENEGEAAGSSRGPLRPAERTSGDQFTSKEGLVEVRDREKDGHLRGSSSEAAALLELAAKFPRDKLVNVNNPCANNVTQKEDRLLFGPNGGGVTGKGRLGGEKNGIGLRSSGMGFEALDPVARQNLLPQLVTAANANNRTAEESSPPLQVSHNRHRRVMGSLIEDNVVSADEFSTIWGSELFK